MKYDWDVNHNKKHADRIITNSYEHLQNNAPTCYLAESYNIK